MLNVAPRELRTARLVLTPLSVADAPVMAGVLADPALSTYTGGGPPTVEDLTRRYEAQVAGSGSDAELWHNWILRLTDGGSAIGFVQATVVGDEADVAWVVGVEWQGAGFAKEAVAAMNGWLIAAGVQRLVAHIHPDHLASQGVAASAGLVRTGGIDEEGEEIWRWRLSPSRDR